MVVCLDFGPVDMKCVLAFHNGAENGDSVASFERALQRYVGGSARSVVCDGVAVRRRVDGRVFFDLERCGVVDPDGGGCFRRTCKSDGSI